ncbi:hypothetical protein J6590_083672 [Homalodisca vitripennis]|nr:hypothetical protein J6590_083672 [Homalodisca vitripennis]
MRTLKTVNIIHVSVKGEISREGNTQVPHREHPIQSSIQGHPRCTGNSVDRATGQMTSQSTWKSSTSRQSIKASLQPCKILWVRDYCEDLDIICEEKGLY